MGDDVVRREVARQTVVLIFGVAGTIATAVVIRFATKPDAFREAKMRAALAGKRIAQRQADRCQLVADYFATRYNEGKV